jgi:outer membrane receptor protein involved in Fe transport
MIIRLLCCFLLLSLALPAQARELLVFYTPTTDDRLPAYSLWNASVGKQFGKAFTARVGINNLTNVRLAEKSPNFGYAERGRTLVASLRADF